MSQLSLSLLGSPQIELEGRPLTGFNSNKVRALLIYLAVEADRPHRRETLAGLLWPDQPDRAARHSLSQALSNLRSLVRDQANTRPLLTVTTDTLRLNRDSLSQLDVAQFVAFQAAVERHQHPRLEACVECIKKLEQAAALYRGQFLEGFSPGDSGPFEEWTVLKRGQFARQILNVLHPIAEHYAARGEFDLARRFAWRQIELDPLHEPAHRQLMQCYAGAGRRSAALRQYRECARLLETELGVAPSEETTRVYLAIRDRQVLLPTTAIQAAVQEDNRSSAPTHTESKLFVARERELARLDQLLEGALGGRPKPVFVIGEAGSGKTALLDEFARRAQEAHSSLLVASGTCNAHTGLGDPYLPFRQILELLTGDVEPHRAGGTITDAHAQRLLAAFPTTAQALLRDGSDLIDTFISGAALAARARSQPTPPNGRNDWQAMLEALNARQTAHGTPRLDQSRLFEQYADVLAAIATRHPLLLLLDDLQWADAGSLSLLFHLGRRLTRSRVLIIGAYRPEDVGLGRDGERHPLEPIINEFRRSFGEIWIDLDQIPETEGRRFIDALIDSEPNRLGSDFRAAMYEQTSGQALFTVELLRGLQARGDLVWTAEGYWAEGPALNWETLPARVEGVIAERIGRLDEALREAITIASVQGETFIAEVIAQVQAANEREMVVHLSQELARQHRLITPQGVRQLAGRRHSLYRFRHNLFQKYLYSHLDPAERAYLHEDVGQVLESAYGDQAADIAVELARHFREAGQPAKAADYLRLAGDRAMRLSAYAEAIKLYTQGLELLKAVPNTLDRAQKELALLTSLGIPLSATRGFAATEVEQTFARAWAVCQQMGETPDLLPTLWGLFYYYLVRAEDRAMRRLADQLMQITHTTPDPAHRAIAHWAMGVTLLYAGELEPARAHLEQMSAYHDPPQPRAPSFRYTTDPGVACRFWNAWALWFLGYPDQALQRSREAQALAEQLSHPFSLAFALFTGSALHQFRREPKAAQQTAEAAIRISHEQGFSFFLGLATVFRGWAVMEQGEIENGLALMRQGLQSAQATGARIGRPHMLAMLAEAHGKAGQPREGLTLLAEALAAAHDSGERHYEAELYRIKGELLLNEGRSCSSGSGAWPAVAPAAAREAEACFEQAIHISRHQQARSLELRATLSLGRLWRHQDKHAAARRRLAEAYGWFSEGFETPDLREARELLNELNTVDKQQHDAPADQP
jgi:DNA-binding SARP family transcriptional activator/predicted ATPase